MCELSKIQKSSILWSHSYMNSRTLTEFARFLSNIAFISQFDTFVREHLFTLRLAKSQLMPANLSIWRVPFRGQIYSSICAYLFNFLHFSRHTKATLNVPTSGLKFIDFWSQNEEVLRWQHKCLHNIPFTIYAMVTKSGLQG